MYCIQLQTLNILEVSKRNVTLMQILFWYLMLLATCSSVNLSSVSAWPNVDAFASDHVETVLGKINIRNLS